ncbi:MAG: hypothetical protein KC431_18085, partial [Myxococcales bacterium]|nr:hypothetical protein [Myxococcales bacterium]
FFLWLGQQEFRRYPVLPNFFAIDYTAGLDPDTTGELPLDDIHALVAQSPWLIALGELDEPKDDETGTQLAFSRDGEHWTLAPGPYLGNMESELAVNNGLLQVLTGSEAGCGGGSQERYLATITVDDTLDPTSLAKLAWMPGDWPFDAPFDRHLGADGWAFAHESCTDEETGASIPDEDDWQGICAVDRRGKQQVLLGFAGAYLLEYGHGQTLLLEGGGLWAIEGGAALKLTRIGEGQPELLAGGVDNATVDGAGHMLVAAGGKMHIGGAEGWSTIVLPKETPKPDITPANAAP